MKPIRKAIFPVAGLGTRFLPATKAMPKEMLTVVDRPIIQLVVDEARDAGIEHFIFVTGRNKGVIEDHFDRQFELEFTLRERRKKSDLELLSRDLPGARHHQLHPPAVAARPRPRHLVRARIGRRRAVRRAAARLLVKAEVGCLAQMIDCYRELGERGNFLAVEEVPDEVTHMYGIVGIGKPEGNALPITQMVEKPPRGTAPSNLIITGRYILQPEIFAILGNQERGAGGEIQLTDAMIRLAEASPFYGVKFEGKTFDCGSKVGFLAANVAYALAREDIAPAFRAELEVLMGMAEGKAAVGQQKKK